MSDPLKLPSWDQYGFHAMRELERMSGVLDEISQKIDTMDKRQVENETRTKIMGSIAGFVAAALVEAGRVLLSLIGKRP